MPVTHLLEYEVDWLKTLLVYDPDTGLFRWLISTWGRGRSICPGDVAGTNKDGYVQIKVGGCLWRAHRLAWVFMTGELPPEGLELDHEDRNRANNKWTNLRLRTRSFNTYNTVPTERSRSGVRGVSWSTKESKWDARITVEKETITLGRYIELNEAISVRRQAELELFGCYLN